MKKRHQQVLGIVTASCLAASTIPMTVFANDASTEEKEKMIVNNVIEKLSPTPQVVNELGDDFTFTSSVNIIGKEVADQDAMRELTSLLAKYGIKVNKELNKDDTTILIGEDEDEIDELNQFFTDLHKDDASKLTTAEGYVLATVADEKGTSHIAIEGKDEKGTFYGVQTLKQLVEKEKDGVHVPEVYIKDHPTQHLRAIVEGFYGETWSHEARLNQFAFYGENKINSYIYAPKSDPYHRDKWREPYPAEELGRMKELIETAKENKVDFVFAISPGKDIRFNEETHEVDPEDYKALLDKAEALYEMGVRSFSILWDDIFIVDGVGQATVLNRFNKDFVKAKGDVTPLITVPTEYWGTSMFNGEELKTYTKDFSRTLDKDIEVMWTGENVMSEGVTPEDAKKIKDIYGRDMLLWWNYPVNDYKEEKLALGPIYNLPNNLNESIGGFIINPMSFAEASKISIHTGADYAWNTAKYDYNKAWDRAIESTVGTELKDSFKVFADHSTRLDTGRADAPEMKAVMDAYWEKVEKGVIPTAEIAALKKEFTNVKNAVEQVKNGLKDPKLMKEINRQLDKLGKYADAATTASDMVVAMMYKDTQQWWDLKSKLSVKIEELNQSTAVISDEVLAAFISKANTITDELFFEGVEKEAVKTYDYTISVSENLQPLKHEDWLNTKAPYELNKMVDGMLDTAYRSKNTIKAGDFISVDLGKVEKLTNIYMNMGRTNSDQTMMKGNLEISEDGKKWTAVIQNNSDHEISKIVNASARYIKYTATEDQDNELFIREFEVNRPTASGIHSNVDGVKEAGLKRTVVDTEDVYSLSTAKGVKFKKNDYAAIELADYNYISSVELKNGGSGKLSYTINGRDWIDFATVKGNDKVELKKPLAVKQVKYTADKTTNTKESFSMAVHVEGRGDLSVETNRKGLSASWPQYNDKNYIIDGDLDHAFISSSPVQKGDYVTLDLGKVKNIRNVQLISDLNSGADRIREGKLEYSVDRKSWKVLKEGSIPERLNMHDLDFDARYLRLTATDSTDSWFRMSDFSVNNPQAEVEFLSTVKPLNDEHRLNNLMDNNIQTSFIPKSEVKAGDKVVYNLFEGKKMNRVQIFQNERTISNAKVIARTDKNKYIELGKLSKGYNVFTLNKTEQIVEISIEFTAGSKQPELFEVITENTSVSNAETITFKDLGPSHRAYTEIQYLAQGKITVGDQKGNFNPNQQVTRAEAAAMIGRALNLDGTKRKTSFKDVGASMFASGYIQSAVDKKILSGYKDGSFKPNEKVTRGEMAIMISRAFGYNSGNTQSEAAKALMSKGISQGMTDGTFGAKLNLIRADFSVFLARAIDANLRLGNQEVTFKQEMTVIKDSLSIHKGPSDSYKQIDTLKKGDKVKIGYDVGEWAYVQTATNKVGFVPLSSLK
ncbi:beta-N-acetylglucosaminidase domain-containing protein [Bacillus sp. 1P06AnD]|uniref:beta-N-acetylglucosaminidase domain-containing protein n=1 Tax=Bacillus sp. 1P06AnD TaxID=3132208 RepID=UPI0039A25E3E